MTSEMEKLADKILKKIDGMKGRCEIAAAYFSGKVMVNDVLLRPFINEVIQATAKKDIEFIERFRRSGSTQTVSRFKKSLLKELRKRWGLE